ncbi:hypothetical protein AB0G55_33560, partial [Streptomyces toyocaensis]
PGKQTRRPSAAKAERPAARAAKASDTQARETAVQGSKAKETKAKETKPEESNAKESNAKESNAKGTKARAAGADGPKLVELVRRHLSEQNEPRSAAEVAGALTEAHPERTIRTTVVRSTLEGLVARNQAQRTKQGSSVFYTVSEAVEQAPKEEANR